MNSEARSTITKGGRDRTRKKMREKKRRYKKPKKIISGRNRDMHPQATHFPSLLTDPLSEKLRVKL